MSSCISIEALFPCSPDAPYLSFSSGQSPQSNPHSMTLAHDYAERACEAQTRVLSLHPDAIVEMRNRLDDLWRTFSVRAMLFKWIMWALL